MYCKKSCIINLFDHGLLSVINMAWRGPFVMDSLDSLDSLDAMDDRGRAHDHAPLIFVGKSPTDVRPIPRCTCAPGPHKPINTQFRAPRSTRPLPKPKSPTMPLRLFVPETPSMSPPPMSPPPPITVHLYDGRTDVHGAINDLWQIAPNETSRLVKCLNTIT